MNAHARHSMWLWFTFVRKTTAHHESFCAKMSGFDKSFFWWKFSNGGKNKRKKIMQIYWNLSCFLRNFTRYWWLGLSPRNFLFVLKRKRSKSSKIPFWLYAMSRRRGWKMRRRTPSYNLHQCVYEHSLLNSRPPQYTLFGKFSCVCFQSWLSIIFIQRFSFFKKVSRTEKCIKKKWLNKFTIAWI